MTNIAGYCPMGCGQTLFVGARGHVTCSLVGCPNPCAVDELLQDRETEHVVSYAENGRWNAQHPLRERLNGELLDCPIHRALAAALPRKPGRYRVKVHHADADSEPYRPGDAGLDFEPIT